MEKRSDRSIEKIYDKKNDLAALVFNYLDLMEENRTVFLPTPLDWGIQLGVSYKDEGYIVEPHYHIRDKSPRRIGVEALLVLEGEISVNLYDTNGSLLKSINLRKGDGIVMKCAHSVLFKNKSIVLEIKEGPYPGSDKDKVKINTSETL